MKKFKPKLLTAALAILAIALAGCALPRPALKAESPVLPTLATPDAANTVGMDGRDYLVQTDDVQPFYIASELEESDPLPDIRLTGITISSQSIYEVMRTILADTNLSFSISGEHVNANVQRRNISAVNVSGSLKSIMDGLSNTLGIYYTYKGGVINITPDRQYIVSIPPVDEAMDSVVAMIQKLGGTDVYLDKPGRVVTFRAAKPAYQKINSYLEYNRTNKNLIIYDAIIWEVVLTDASSTGIQWNKFSYNNGLGGAAPVTTTGTTSTQNGAIPAPDVVQGVNLNGGQTSSLPGSLGFAMVYNTSRFAMDVLASFLKTQGTLNTLSQPKLSMLTGGKATLKTGKETPYLAGFGSTIINNSIINTTTFAKFLSGLDMTLTGDYSDGTVFTHVKLELTDFLNWVDMPSNGQITRQPETTRRYFESDIRVHPGHTIMLAGINIQRNATTDSGLPGSGDSIVPTYRDRNLQRSELVMVLKPRIIRFGNKKPAAASDLPAAGGKEAASHD